ncbi:MAG: tail fiber protein [Pelosinus sp.]|nr:tail fiber protein [Pelosinus sp.]
MAEAFIGEIRLFAGNISFLTGQCWILCNGASYSVQQFESLYAVIGNRYGGTPNQNFCVPDLSGKVPMGMQQGAGNLGSVTGSTTVALTTANMPSHTHQLVGQSAATQLLKSDPTNRMLSNTTVPIYAATKTDNANLNTAAVSTFAGSAEPHSNIQPYLGINFYICYDGYFPVSS